MTAFLEISITYNADHPDNVTVARDHADEPAPSNGDKRAVGRMTVAASRSRRPNPTPPSVALLRAIGDLQTLGDGEMLADSDQIAAEAGLVSVEIPALISVPRCSPPARWAWRRGAGSRASRTTQGGTEGIASSRPRCFRARRQVIMSRLSCAGAPAPACRAAGGPAGRSRAPACACRHTPRGPPP
jgi:hypothetical protein